MAGVTFLTGQRLTADLLNQIPKGQVAFWQRGVTGSVTAVGATETGFVRLDGIAVRNGYTYRVEVPRTIMTLTNTTTGAAMRLRGTQSGNATAASTLLDGGEIRIDSTTDTSNPLEAPLVGRWRCTADGTLSVIVTVARISGAGSAGVFASSGNVVSTFVDEIGVTPTASGTDL